MKFQLIVSFLFSLLISSTGLARDIIFLVGGGETLDSSQISIRKNSQWILQILNKQRPDDHFHFHFTDADDPAVDVFQHIKPMNLEQKLQLIFSQGGDLQIQSSSRFDQPHKGSSAAEVMQALQKALAAQTADSNLLFIYQGHGDKDYKDTNDNYLRLWQKSKLPASELAALLDRYPNKGHKRFLFPQCYSGSFARLIYKGMNPARGLTADSRCGFVSQLEFLVSEGCTASINEDDYRDYSTFFFEALTGKTRTGKALKENPDFDGDGRISLYEAHLYTLRNAFSIDFSTATSEAYLLHWHNWKSRWTGVKLDPNNTYYRIALKLAADAGMGEDLIAQSVQRKLRRQKLKQKIQQSHHNIRAFADKLAHDQKQLARDLLKRWPTLLDNQKQPILPGDPATQTKIAMLIARNGLFQGFDDLQVLQDKLTLLERQQAQLTKIARMLDLARTQQLFQLMATEQEKKDYKRLLLCEQLSLK